MSIHSSDGTSFQKVSKVYRNFGSNGATRIQRVWVHNGSNYVLVNGRLLEKVWEKDLSTYGGMSWDNDDREPYNNIITHPQILSDGSLIGVIPYIVNNNSSNQYSTGRYALIELSPTNGDISYFSNYTSWVKWKALSGYYYTAQPFGLIKCGNNFVAFNEFGIFYSFNSSGTYRSKYENTDWHIDGTAKYIDETTDNIRVCYEESGGCLYFELSDDNPDDTDSTKYMSSIYRMGISGTDFKTPRKHYKGVKEFDTNVYSNSVLIDNETHRGIAYFSGSGGTEDNLVVFNADYSYSSTTSEVSALCSTVVFDGDEIPVAAKGGYVYTYIDSGTGKIRKRSISDLSTIWTVSIPSVYSGSECDQIHQPLPACDGGFMLPNGDILYEDGYIAKGSKVFNKSTSSYTSIIKSFNFDESLGVGYMMCYTSTSGSEQCSVIKFKEVSK